MSLIDAIKLRFPSTEIEMISTHDTFDIIRFSIEHAQKRYLVISTSGLWKYTMPVTHKYEGSEHIELGFCVEADWHFEDENYNWIFQKLEWLANFMIERKTWFGVGHTIPNGKPAQTISKAFQQDHFFFDEASFLEREFQPFRIDNINVHFLFIIPISKSELDYKMKKTTFGFQKKMSKKGVNEVLEDFRVDIADKEWKLW